MLGVSKLSVRAAALLPALLAAALLAVAVWQRPDGPPQPAMRLDGWDVPRLAEHLNEQGLGLRLVAAGEGAAVARKAYLTRTGKGAADFNLLAKDPGQAHVWRGSLYCERGPAGADWSQLRRQWGGCCLAAGPFILFGDPDLLAQARAALAAPK
jgi:hypothetical protein